MLAELGLIYEEHRGHFAFRRGPKATLSDGMFAYALIDYWNEAAPGLSSLAFESIALARVLRGACSSSTRIRWRRGFLAWKS